MSISLFELNEIWKKNKNLFVRFLVKKPYISDYIYDPREMDSYTVF